MPPPMEPAERVVNLVVAALWLTLVTILLVDGWVTAVGQVMIDWYWSYAPELFV